MRARLVMTAVLLLASPAVAQPSRSGEDPRSAALAQLLQPASAEFDDAALDDIVTYIQQVTGVSIDPVWDDQGATGLARDATVTMHVDGLPMLTLLERVLDKADDDFDPATWQFSEDGILEIGPRSALNRHAYPRIYDVNDLIFEIPDFTDVPDLELGQIVQGQGGSRQDVELDIPAAKSQAERLDDLVGLIESTVEFDQWRNNGGDGADISVYRGSLLVRAPGYIHRQIGGVPYWPSPAQVRRAAR